MSIEAFFETLYESRIGKLNRRQLAFTEIGGCLP